MASPAATDRAVAALNRLLAAEYVNLLPRLADADPFVSWAAADENLALQDMFQEEARHIPWLSETILDLGGAPVAHRVNQQLAAVHFQDIHALMPEVLENKRNLIALYERESSNVSHVAAAADVAGRCLEQHRANLARLEAISAPPAQNAAAVPADS